jgi:hypothetical protein
MAEWFETDCLRFELGDAFNGIEYLTKLVEITRALWRTLKCPKGWGIMMVVTEVNVHT